VLDDGAAVLGVDGVVACPARLLGIGRLDQALERSFSAGDQGAAGLGAAPAQEAGQLGEGYKTAVAAHGGERRQLLGAAERRATNRQIASNGNEIGQALGRRSGRRKCTPERPHGH
jgi:hypothetical protein